MCVCVCIAYHIIIFTLTNIYIYILEYYSAIKKNKMMPSVTTWMSFKIILSEVSPTEKEKYL